MSPGRVADEARLERLEEVLLRLRQEAAGQLVVVEGDRDTAALDALGVGGRHIKVNLGRSLQEWMDRVADEAQGRRVIILVDWDRTGGRLAATLAEGLRARVGLDVDNRRRLAHVCHCRCVEDVPAELASLRRSAR